MSDRSPTEKREDMILKEYLAGLKLQEGDKEELLLPDEDPPAGFDFTYHRCCRRTLYPYGDFTILLSKERVYRMDGKDETDNTETVCITLTTKHMFSPDVWEKSFSYAKTFY